LIVFADSSAVVTRYAPAETNVLPIGANVVVSDLARVEVVSALWRKLELAELTSVEAAHLVRDFEADWTGLRFRSVQLRAAVLARAAGLSGTHRLRSLDAIQLASALTTRDVEPDCSTMVVLDERLRKAAATERFALLPA
jgi:predicted nucleic acid-binding protein